MNLTRKEYMTEKHHEIGPEISSEQEKTLEELIFELTDKYQNTEHHVASKKRLGMEELNQLSTELQYFFEKYEGDDSDILVRYIEGRLEEGEMEKLIEGLKEFYTKYLETHE